MQKIVQIVGPTATGKTALAVEIAKKFNGVLISADSIQVYKHLDIISGKDIPSGSEFNLIKKISGKFDLGYYFFDGVKIHLLDVVNSTVTFSVYDFLRISQEVFEVIKNEKKIPIVVGGTGLYTHKLLEGLDNSSLKVDIKLRNRLSVKTVGELQEMLDKLNPEKIQNMNNSDVNNSRRLIRAIEITLNSKKQNVNREEKNHYESLVVGLKCDRNILKKRIDKRVGERLKNGALEEAELLFRNYLKLASNVKTANGYKQMFSYLQKEIDFDEAIYRWKISEYRHAKNQMTWFKKYGKTKWFDIEKSGFKKSIEQEIASFLS